jgi:hypothetical protein
LIEYAGQNTKYVGARADLSATTAAKSRLGMIRKSGNRFSEKIMPKQRDEIMMRFNLIAS